MYNSNDHTYVICAYKVSAYLEECIVSLKNQSVSSNIIMATSTPNQHIKQLALKYGIELFINTGESGIGGDWNFAYDLAKTQLVTIAHQDDIYKQDYTEKILSCANKSKNPIICFSGYGELRNGKEVINNRLLKIKKLLLFPLRFSVFQGSVFVRRRILSLGNAICCPAVTYIKKNVGPSPFTNNYKSNIDWEQWEILSRKKGDFVYNKEPLMLHRVHNDSTTSELIADDSRTAEDYDMFLKFWPKPIAALICGRYVKGQKSNDTKQEEV